MVHKCKGAVQIGTRDTGSSLVDQSAKRLLCLFGRTEIREERGNLSLLRREDMQAEPALERVDVILGEERIRSERYASGLFQHIHIMLVEWKDFRDIGS